MTIYLKLTNISGNVTDKNHQGWVDVDGYQMRMRRRVNMRVGQANNRGVSLPSIKCFEIVKSLDKSSILVLTAMLTGKVIDSCQIDVCHAGDGAQVHSQYILSNAMISHYEDSCGKYGLGKEYLRIAYTKLQRKCIPFDAAGKAGSPVIGGYDLEQAIAS